MIEFLKYTKKDLKQLSKVKKQCRMETYLGIYPNDEVLNFNCKEHEKRFLSFLNDKMECYKIVDNKKIIGYLTFQPVESENVKKVYIKSLYILKAYQKQGIGKKAFEIVKNYCKANNIFVYYNNCNAHNLNALAFYAHLGGKITNSNLGNENKKQDQITFEYVI